MELRRSAYPLAASVSVRVECYVFEFEFFYFFPLRCFVVNDHVGPLVLPTLFLAVTIHVYGVANASEETVTEGLVKFDAYNAPFRYTS
jgi:hypothetical protein